MTKDLSDLERKLKEMEDRIDAIRHAYETGDPNAPELSQEVVELIKAARQLRAWVARMRAKKGTK